MNPVDPDKTALVVIDMQNGFVTDRSRHVVPLIQRHHGSSAGEGARSAA